MAGYAEEPIIVIGREYVSVLRRKLQAQDTIAECSLLLAQLEERLRRLTQGQVYGQTDASRLPLPETGEGTRVIRTERGSLSGDPSLLGLKDEPQAERLPPWSFEYRAPHA